jgi:hypothetical protein
MRMTLIQYQKKRGKQTSICLTAAKRDEACYKLFGYSFDKMVRILFTWKFSYIESDVIVINFN